MSAKLPEAKKHLAETISENWSDQLELGGSQSGYVACYAANQVLGTIWRGGRDDPATKEIRDEATLRRVSDIGARDVVEAMLAAQMVATHEAAMECFRQAALSFAGREMGLKYGEKLVRSFAALTEALNRHRGKGQQVVRVEHVTVAGRGAGDRRRRQPGGGGGQGKVRIEPMHRQPLPMHLSRRCGARTRHGSPCRSPALRIGSAAGCTAAPRAAAPTGNRNAFKHGRYTRELLEFRHCARAAARECREARM